MDSSRRYIGIEVPNWMGCIQLTLRKGAVKHATTVAVDLAKEVFELAFADAEYRIVQRKRLSRRAFALALGNSGPLRVIMEACGNGPSATRSPQGRIRDCNRLHSPAQRAPY